MWVGAPSVFWILDSGFWIPSSLGRPLAVTADLYSGFWILDSGFQAPFKFSVRARTVRIQNTEH